MRSEKLTLSNTEKLDLLSNLSTMITAGIPILEAVDSLLEDSKGNSKLVLQIIKEDLIQGHHLYSSFAKFPNIFNQVTVNILRASEEAGTLDITLKDLRDYLQKDIEFNDKVKQAFIYPIFITIVFLIVLLLILTVVVPKISVIFTRLNMTLPLPTLILVYASNIILNHTILVMVGTVTFLTGLYFFYKSQKERILNVIYSLPLISILVKEIDLARFSRNMSLLLTSGITINSALDMTEEVVMRKDISAAIRYTKEMVLVGKDLSQSFKEQKKIFSGVIIKIIEAAEKTGTLDKSMQEVSEQMDYQVANRLKVLTTLIEPLMLMLVGFLVGGMMLSIMAPIYGLIGQVGSR